MIRKMMFQRILIQSLLLVLKRNVLLKMPVIVKNLIASFYTQRKPARPIVNMDPALVKVFVSTDILLASAGISKTEASVLKLKNVA